MLSQNSTDNRSLVERCIALFDDHSGISPVIGVLLMVAVVVVLSGVVGAFVFTIGDGMNEPAPTTEIAFEYDDSTGTLIVTHDGGDTLSGDKTGTLAVTGSDNATVTAWTGDTSANNSEYGLDSELQSGDEIAAVNVTGAGGDTIDLTWSSESGGNSATLGSYDLPSNTGTGGNTGGSTGSLTVSPDSDGDTIGVNVTNP